MRKGDVESAEAIFSEHEASLLRIARRFVDPEQAREVVQDTFVRFLERRDEVAGKLPQWLFTVCKNRAIDVARRENVRRAPVPAASLDSSPAVKLDVARALRAIDKLPARQRRIVEMRLAGGASYREIGAALGISESNVGYLMHTALKTIREELGVDR